MSIERIQQITINKLLDKYEKSKTFTGENQVNQSFERRVGELFPKYNDDAEYELFCDVNEALKELEKLGFVHLKIQRNGVIVKVALNVYKQEECYHYVGRQPKKEENEWLLEVMHQFAGIDVLDKYFKIQKTKIAKNQKVEYFDGQREAYLELLQFVVKILENEDEQYIRDFSINIFQDSKRAEQLANKAQALLFQYGDYQDKDSVLEECGIVKTPTYVSMKGQAILILGGQTLDLSKMKGDVSLSTASLKELSKVQVIGKRVVTVENLTSFHDYEGQDDFVIYLGGFHNKVKRTFLMFLYEQNYEKEYLHFGDIDAGGFYIFEHLKAKTGIPFKTLYMDVETLMRYASQTKRLTQNDRLRINSLLAKQGEYKDVLGYMLENDCKLEQEAVNIYR